MQQARQLFDRLGGCFAATESDTACDRVAKCYADFKALDLTATADQNKAASLIAQAMTALVADGSGGKRPDRALRNRLILLGMMNALPRVTQTEAALTRIARHRFRNLSVLVRGHPVFNCIDLRAARAGITTFCDCATHISTLCDDLFQKGREAYDAKFGQGAFDAKEAAHASPLSSSSTLLPSSSSPSGAALLSPISPVVANVSKSRRAPTASASMRPNGTKSRKSRAREIATPDAVVESPCLLSASAMAALLSDEDEPLPSNAVETDGDSAQRIKPELHATTSAILTPTRVGTFASSSVSLS